MPVPPAVFRRAPHRHDSNRRSGPPQRAGDGTVRGGEARPGPDARYGRAMAFEEYVRSEVVADYAEGFLTRREALRRLMLLGTGAAAAGALLAACGGGSSRAKSASSTSSPSASSTTATGPAQPVGPAPLATEAVA